VFLPLFLKPLVKEAVKKEVPFTEVASFQHLLLLNSELSLMF
jgi:hypothetical protein